MTGYYDYVLGLIPAALIGVTAVLNLAGLSLTAALPGGALAAGAVMAHAIFVKAPVTSEARVRTERSAGRTGVRRSRGGRARTGGAD